MNSRETADGRVQAGRTAGEAGWKISRYNLSAQVPGKDEIAIANLFKGTCVGYTPPELYLLSVLDRLREDHPIIERFAQRGIITRTDERAALETMGRAACGAPFGVGLTLCPTMTMCWHCMTGLEEKRRV